MAKTQHRSVRVDDERWRLLGERTESIGSTRGDVIQQFIAWYLRERGAKLPERPSASSVAPGHARGRSADDRAAETI